MIRSSVGLWVSGLAVCFLTSAVNVALGQGAWGNGPVPGSQQSARHNPNSPNYADFSRGYSQDALLRMQRPAAATNVQSSPSLPISTGVSFGTPTGFVAGYPLGFGVYSSYYGYPGWDYGYGGFAPAVPPAAIAAAQPQFGPLGVQQFMGVNPVPGLPPQPQIPLGAGQRFAPANNQADAPSDANAREKAWKLIDLGNAAFAQRHFADALGRYRGAAKAADDLAEAWFRQGHVMVALGHYSDAAKAYRRGLELDPKWADSDFRLTKLYAGDHELKASHFAALQAALQKHPQDPDLLFVLGVYLYFDGQVEESAPCFRQAAVLLGPNAAGHLQGFLKHLPAEKKAAPAPPPAAADDPFTL